MSYLNAHKKYFYKKKAIASNYKKKLKKNLMNFHYNLQI
jgi:hypothetical protein